MTQQILEALLKTWTPKGWAYNLVDSGFVQMLDQHGDRLQITLQVPFSCQNISQELPNTFAEQLDVQCGIKHVQFQVKLNIATLACRLPDKIMPGVKNIIVVASGKGGVGKSTVAFNLALALMQEGAKVGVLDADIYGPSLPMMMGCVDALPQSPDGRTMLPIERFGLKANSIGFLVPASDATVWRGPMASKALVQLFAETQWGDLDYLIVDLPPGTGDIQLTLAQQLPTTASLVVTTPQNLAFADAFKGVAMFEKVQIPVLGVVENMSFFQCPVCSHQAHIFGQGGGGTLSHECQLPLLAQLPLEPYIRECADDGVPLLVTKPEHALSGYYRSLARQVAARLYFSGSVTPTRLFVKSTE